MSTKVVKQKRTMSETSATVWEQEGKGGGAKPQSDRGKERFAVIYCLCATDLPIGRRLRQKHQERSEPTVGETQIGAYDEISRESGETVKRQSEETTE